MRRGMMRSIANGSKRFIQGFSPPTVAALTGSALTAYGLHMLYAPLAYIVPGIALTWFGLWLAGLSLPERRGRRD